jgi:hypothetical protein
MVTVKSEPTTTCPLAGETSIVAVWEAGVLVGGSGVAVPGACAKATGNEAAAFCEASLVRR